MEHTVGADVFIYIRPVNSLTVSDNFEVCTLSILASLDNLVAFLLGDSMARKPRLFAPGVLYHVIVQGGFRQKTFFNDGDYQAYIARLGRYRMQFGVTIYAYCLMSNQGNGMIAFDSCES